MTEKKSIDWPKLWRVLGYAKPYKLLVGTAIISIVGKAIIAPLKPALFGMMVQQYIVDEYNPVELKKWALIIGGMTILEAILQLTDAITTNYIGQSIIVDLRDKLFCAIAFFCAARVSAICNIKFEDILKEESGVKIRLHEKNGKIRYLHCNSQILAPTLKKFLERVSYSNGFIFRTMRKGLFTESKKLRVFDFDDTLVKTTSFIYVTNGDKKKKLTPGQYAVYNEKPGDEFDYSDFSKVKNPNEIKKITSVLRRIVSSSGGDGVHILTARAAHKPIRQYLKDIGINMSKIYVTALASNNPKDKADWIEDKIDNEGYDDVYFADDSKKNVDATKKMLRGKDVRWRVQHIKH